jgi:cell wall-associated NlpC family hydrolase
VTNLIRPGRSADRQARLAPNRFLLAAALACFAAPAAAAPVVQMSADEAAALAALAPMYAADAPSLPDRAAMAGGDVNHLLPAQATSSTANAAETAEAGRVQSLLQRALALLGTPYRWGGTSPDGFDCSGLVGYVFRTALGIDLPRVSRDQARTGQLVADRGALAAGDLVFFGRRGRVDHVGIYVGEGQFVHAPSRGKDVMVSRLDGGYWGGRFMSGRRIVATGS